MRRQNSGPLAWGCRDCQGFSRGSGIRGDGFIVVRPCGLRVSRWSKLVAFLLRSWTPWRRIFGDRRPGTRTGMPFTPKMVLSSRFFLEVCLKPCKIDRNRLRRLHTLASGESFVRSTSTPLDEVMGLDRGVPHARPRRLPVSHRGPGLARLDPGAALTPIDVAAWSATVPPADCPGQVRPATPSRARPG